MTEPRANQLTKGPQIRQWLDPNNVSSQATVNRFLLLLHHSHTSTLLDLILFCFTTHSLKTEAQIYFIFIFPLLFRFVAAMSFDRLSSLESQPSNDAQYQDDPEFQKLTEKLSNELFTLTSNISRLSNQIGLLGTKRDTERVRERVHDLLEETRDGFRDVGEGIKKVQTWEDVNVSISYCYCVDSALIPSPGDGGCTRRYWDLSYRKCLTIFSCHNLAITKMDATEALFGVQVHSR